MKYTVLKIFCLFIIIILSFACQDVIDLDVPDTVNSIAISGRVSDADPAYVSISTTAGYFDQGQTARIEGAVVKLYENGIFVSELVADTIPGLYRSDFTGSLGNTYFIEVEIPEGTSGFKASTWRSQAETIRRVFNLDSINIRLLNRTTTPPSFSESYFALMYFQEPEGGEDRYRIRRWINDSIFTQDISLLADDGPPIDGLYVGEKGGFPALSIYEIEQFSDEDTLIVEISSLTKNYYEYLSLVSEQVFQVGSPFDPPAQTVIGNIYNADNPDEYGFGYFAASSLSVKKRVLIR